MRPVTVLISYDAREVVEGWKSDSGHINLRETIHGWQCWVPTNELQSHPMRCGHCGMQQILALPVGVEPRECGCFNCGAKDLAEDE